VKEIEFLGTSLDDLREFPEIARRRSGFQLQLVQSGRDPDDWKPMATVGSGCREIRVRDPQGTYRMFYVAVMSDVVFVLHCFQKKTQKTAKSDLDLGRQRFKAMVEKERKRDQDDR
jgi:phage-related protein